MPKLNVKMEAQSQFGLPPTPPSSLPSDDSEGNLSPDHHGAPMSPQTTPVSQTSTRRSAIAAATTTAAVNSSKIYSGVSTRQPIHTPLISNQPVSAGNSWEIYKCLIARDLLDLLIPNFATINLNQGNL